MTQAAAVTWKDLLEAPGSDVFRCTAADASRGSPRCVSEELLLTQSNGRLLLGQAPTGAIRFLCLPLRLDPVRPISRGFGPGMYCQSAMLFYFADLRYRLELPGDPAGVDLVPADRSNQSRYAGHFLPVTTARHHGIEATVSSCAPVAADAECAALAPAPLPGLAGALSIVRLVNRGGVPTTGKLVLETSSLLTDHYSSPWQDFAQALAETPPARARLFGAAGSSGCQVLALHAPFGHTMIDAEQGRWSLDGGRNRATWEWTLEPGAEAVFVTRIALATDPHELRATLLQFDIPEARRWVERTAEFWASRLGRLQVARQGQAEAGPVSRDIYLRCLIDNFNCLQTDAAGRLTAHWQGAPAHQFGSLWGIDVEPTAASVAQVAPQLATSVLNYFAKHCRASASEYGLEHSVPILVAPLIVARRILDLTGDAGFLTPELVADMETVVRDLLGLQARQEVLFPSRYSSDGQVGKRYDFGTNVKVHYALESWAEILEAIGREGTHFRDLAQDLAAAVDRHMVKDGPFGPQFSGGTGLDEPADPFYPANGMAAYYDGEDSSSALAPTYGFCDLADQRWVNYHRWAASLHCPNFDPEFGALRWHLDAGSPLTGTGYLSRLGGSATAADMLDALADLRRYDCDELGSAYWWPENEDCVRRLTHCSQGQGAWAWQYLEQWLGVRVDARRRVLTIAPRGLPTSIDWQGAAFGRHRFDLHWQEADGAIALRVANLNPEPWCLRVGFRPQAEDVGGHMVWQEEVLAGQATVQCTHRQDRSQTGRIPSLRALQARALADKDGVVIRRFGALLRSWFEQVRDLRFLVINASQARWERISCTLRAPEGWLVTGRTVGTADVTTPDYQAEVVTDLPGLDPLGQTVAAFHWKAPFPDNYALLTRYAHCAEEPILMESSAVQCESTVAFALAVHIERADGLRLERTLTVPFRVVPEPAAPGG